MSKVSMINCLLGVLPYPAHWYESLGDKQIEAMYKQNLGTIAMKAIERDELETRRRLGLV